MTIWRRIAPNFVKNETVSVMGGHAARPFAYTFADFAVDKHKKHGIMITMGEFAPDEADDAMFKVRQARIQI